MGLAYAYTGAHDAGSYRACELRSDEPGE